MAPALGSTADQLEVVKGQVRVKGNSSKALSWKDACAKIGAAPINAHGKNLGGSGGGPEEDAYRGLFVGRERRLREFRIAAPNGWGDDGS